MNTDFLTNPATNPSLETMRLAFTQLPEEFLRLIQTQLGEELQRRASLAPCLVIEEADVNLATGGIRETDLSNRQWVIKRMGFDFAGTIATMQARLDHFFQCYTDRAVIDVLGMTDPFVELLANMEEPVIDLTDAAILEIFERPFFALISRAVKKECDRRASMITTNSQGGV